MSSHTQFMLHGDPTLGLMHSMTTLPTELHPWPCGVLFVFLSFFVFVFKAKIIFRMALGLWENCTGSRESSGEPCLVANMLAYNWWTSAANWWTQFPRPLRDTLSYLRVPSACHAFLGSSRPWLFLTLSSIFANLAVLSTDEVTFRVLLLRFF